MRREWTRLERGDGGGAWRNSRTTFPSQVVGPDFEEICRDWAMAAEPGLFGEPPGEVAAAVVNDPANRTQIQVDVAVLAAEDPGRRRRVLSLGEARWDGVMTVAHLERLRRARDLLAVQGFETAETVLVCYGGGGFDDDLTRAARTGPRVLLVDPATLYA